VSDTPIVPRRVMLLEQALRPVYATLVARLDAPPAGTAAVSDMVALLSIHLEAMRAACGRLEARISDVMNDVLANDAAGDAVVQRSAARFAAVVEDLLDGHRDVRVSVVHGDDAQARDLLAGAYRHLLVEIRDWLGEVVEALADPQAVARRRGLALDDPIELELNLRLTPAPQLGALARWARRHPARLGPWEKVALLAIGWWAGSALFGDNDDCG
jgi:hypothetical protein